MYQKRGIIDLDDENQTNWQVLIELYNYNTGYDYEELLDWEGLPWVDVLVDGKYVKEMADPLLPWRGSSNQRLVDVKRSLAEGRILLWR